jgi:hypothetical protein
MASSSGADWASSLAVSLPSQWGSLRGRGTRVGRPRSPETSHGSTTTVQPLWQALYDFNADLILEGHEHNYERFAPLTATGTVDTARGIRSFVVGTGGRSHYGFGTPITGSEVRNGTTYGVLEVTLASNSYNWQFLPVSGQTFTDSGTQACH